MVAIESTRVSSRGQVVIPKSVRDRLGLREGDELSVEELDDAIVLRVRRRKDPALFGPPLTVEQLLEQVPGRHRGPPVDDAEAQRRMRAGLRRRRAAKDGDAPRRSKRAAR